MFWGMFEKKKRELPIPPPAPTPRSSISDIPAIKPKPEPSLPEFPEIHDEPPQLPEFPEVHDEPPMPVAEIPRVVPSVEREPPSGPTDHKNSFISIDEYEQIATQANAIRDRLKESERLVKELNEVRTEEEKTFEKWRVLLENLEKKLSYVDTIIEQGETG